MELLTTTLYQAHALFYTMPEGMPPDPALPCGLLFSTLESTTGQHPAGEGTGSSICRQEVTPMLG